MKSKVLIEYIHSNIFCIEWNLKLFQKNKGENALHDLRVSIKKIRAILSFLKKNYKNVDIPNSSDLNPLFVASGKIREIQLHIELLLKLPKPPEKLISRFRKIENKLITQFLIDLPHFFNSVEIFEHGLTLPNEIPSKKILITYFDECINKATKKRITKGKKSELHVFRKRIKKMMFVFNALPKSLKKHFDLNKKYINKIEVKAGKWHDVAVALQILKECKEMPASDLKILIKKERKHYNSLIKHLSDFKKNSWT